MKSTEAWALAVAVGVGGAVVLGHELALRVSATAELGRPPTPQAPTSFEAQARSNGLIQADGHASVCLPEQHYAGYVYTPHRYPRSTGGNVSSLLHKGYATFRIPQSPFAEWIVDAPSEDAW